MPKDKITTVKNLTSDSPHFQSRNVLVMRLLQAPDPPDMIAEPQIILDKCTKLSGSLA